ncbi:hypothetical protein [Peptostreptococcus faecalis]|uniref:hypothetical protein n=1 Tax=Peptostreptococcus faecalis TaxID=2045015 RepID=UPI0011AFD0C4|nr:hypothetical protein [Peptostreptococcus faecalis]
MRKIFIVVSIIILTVFVVVPQKFKKEDLKMQISNSESSSKNIGIGVDSKKAHTNSTKEIVDLYEAVSKSNDVDMVESVDSDNMTKYNISFYGDSNNFNDFIKTLTTMNFKINIERVNYTKTDGKGEYSILFWLI